MPDFEKMRTQMVTNQLVEMGIFDQRVIEAMRRVPRQEFVLADWREHAYENRPLPIAANQTISQPHVVAYMIEALAIDETSKVLEIGAGSGYAAAVLAEIANEVYAIERIEELVQSASSALRKCSYHNVQVRHDDGTRGWPEKAPFDAILVSAAAANVPATLKEQLKIGGRMVLPVGGRISIQQLIKITRREEDRFDEEQLAAVRFVPLISDDT